MKKRIKRFTISLVLVVSLAVFAGQVLCGQAFAARTYSPDGKGYLEYITTDTGHQQPFLHLEGSGYEMGFQHGYLLGPATKNILTEDFMINFCREYVLQLGTLGKIIETALLADIGKLMGMDFPNSMRPADLIYTAFKMVAKNNEKYIPQEYLDEMQGIVDGAGAVGVDLKYEDVLLVNVGFDALLSFGYPVATPFIAAAGMLGNTDIRLFCNAFVMDGNATVDDNLYLGRDFMFYGIDLTDNPLIYEFCGTGRNRVVSVGVVGLIGSMAAMNDKGLGIGMDMVPSVDCTPFDFGMGTLLTARNVMEQADELSQGVSIIRDSKRGVSWLYVLADGRGVERGGVSVETSAHHVFTRDMKWTDISPLEAFFSGRPGVVSQQEDYPDFVLQTNHYMKPDMYFNVPLNAATADSVHRYDRMMEIFMDPSHELGGYGTYDFDKAFNYINWMYLTGEDNETPDSRVNQSTTLFDLTNLKMKTLCGPTFAEGATEYVLPAGPPPPSAFSFKSYHGTYLCAENNGGKTVNADRTAIGDWEKFVMVGTDGQTDNIMDGETVTIRTGKNYYFNAKKKTRILWWYTGGGLDADMTAPQAFTLINHTRPGCVLQDGDLVSLKTVYSTYVVAESDGDALADRTSIGNWEKFNVIFH